MDCGLGDVVNEGETLCVSASMRDYWGSKVYELTYTMQRNRIANS